MLPLDLKNLIYVEQLRQDGEFIRGISVDEYIAKIENKAEILIHHVEGSNSGFLAFYCNNYASKEGYIALLLIAESGRGKGLGGELLGSALTIMRHRGFRICNLEVRAGNSSAMKLYARFGFEIVTLSKTNIKMQVRL
jgi:ribosomal protein S18 acetylase RimI-like enzyme